MRTSLCRIRVKYIYLSNYNLTKIVIWLHIRYGGILVTGLIEGSFIQGVLINAIYDLIKTGAKGALGNDNSKEFNDVFRKSLKDVSRRYSINETDFKLFLESKEVTEHLRLHLDDRDIDFNYLGHILVEEYAIYDPELASLAVDYFFQSLRANLLMNSDLREQLKMLYQDKQIKIQTNIKDEIQKLERTSKLEIGKEKIEQQKELLDSIFDRPDEKFAFLIRRNFLYKFNNSAPSDYTQLLSEDFRNLFFNRFNHSNFVCISGMGGVGKTFNCLLICKILCEEGYDVYYQSIRKKSFSAEIFKNLLQLNKEMIFIVDDCQSDIEKTRDIIETATCLQNQVYNKKIIFLTRPLSGEDMREIYGKEIPVIKFNKLFNNLEYLIELFFRKIGRENEANQFILLIKKKDLSMNLFNYRNMEFWNNFFCYLEDESKFEDKITEKEFYKAAYNFFIKREDYFIKYKHVFSKFIPFFVNELPIYVDFINKLQIQDDDIKALIENNIIDLEILDWNDKELKIDSARFIVSKIHSTKAKIVGTILEKYENVNLNSVRSLLDYIQMYPENIYNIITPIYFNEPKLFNELCKEDQFTFTFKGYVRKKQLGKQLDRVIKSFSKLEPSVKNKLIDDEVIEEFAKGLNNKNLYLVNKIFLLSSFYKASPLKAYELYKKIDSKMIINAFNEIPDEQGVPTLRKFMQLFKNLQSLYLFSINKKFAEDLKTNHIAEEMINEFHKNGYLLPKRSIIIREGKFRWKIADEHISYIVRGKSNLKVCLSLDDDTKREADIYINSMEILDGCLEVFMRKFERHNFITQLHWLLKDLNGIGDPYSHLNLAGYLIGKIPPEKIINWMKNKDTRIGELRFILRAARFTSIDVNGKILNLYFDFYKKLIDYDLAKKLFNNERTTLYDIAITSKFSNEILAEHFFNYSLENDFLEKISRENNLYRINETIDLIMANSALTQYQKNSIISKIIDKFKFEYKIFRNTEQVAQKIGKTIDLEFEKKRFIEFRKKLKIDENEVVPLLKY